MKVLITGGAGFIGSELAKALLVDGHDVTIIDNLEYGYRDNFEDNQKLRDSFVEEDIRSSNIEKYIQKSDIVFHLAGISSLPECESNPYKAFDVNTSGVANILNYCRNSNVKRIIFSSTSAIYENSDTTQLLVEDCDVRPNLVYATSKYCAEKVCKSFADNYGMDIIICRFFNVFGAHQDYKRKYPPFTSYLIKEIINDRIPTVFNTSDVKRDYIYSTDLIEIFKRMIQSENKFKAEIFNLGSGRGYSAMDIVRSIYSSLNKKEEFDVGDPEKFWDKYESLFSTNYSLSKDRVKKEVYKHCVGNNLKVVKEFGYEPKIELEEGIQNIVEYQLEKK
jgi:nucleoside-diphosphate-sugar epimerase